MGGANTDTAIPFSWRRWSLQSLVNTLNLIQAKTVELYQQRIYHDRYVNTICTYFPVWPRWLEVYIFPASGTMRTNNPGQTWADSFSLSTRRRLGMGKQWSMDETKSWFRWELAQAELSTPLVPDTDDSSLMPALLRHKETPQGTQSSLCLYGISATSATYHAITTHWKAQNARRRGHFTGGVLLWYRPRRQHSKVPPMRAQFLEWVGPMRVLYSAWPPWSV